MPVWWALGPADHDAVGPLLDHVQEHVGVFLFVGGQAAVALGVGHGAVDGPGPCLWASMTNFLKFSWYWVPYFWSIS